MSASTIDQYRRGRGVNSTDTQPPSRLPYPDRHTILQALARPEGFDLAVIGGGATGLAIALQAAWAGRSVALVEARDFASGTSSRSTKLLHGGVRYLAQGEISLVREALHERKSLIELGPRLARPLRFVMPAYRWWERAFYGSGLLAYQALAGQSSLGRTDLISRADTQSRYPQLIAEGLRGAVSYFDAQFDDAGFALAMARGAAKAGAVVLNRVQALSVQAGLNRSAAVSLIDRETGTRLSLTARDVVNASGIWVDALRSNPPIVQPSQGAHIVVDRRFFPSDDALLLPRTADGRVLFVIPWLGHCVIGTTDTPRDSSDVALGQEPLPFSEEIDLILKEVSRLLSPAPRRSDILSAWAGLRPLVRPVTTSNPSSATKASTHKISREHSIEVDAHGMLTITGGKWTTCMAMARDALRSLPHQPLTLDAPQPRRLPDDAPDCANRAPTAAEVVWLCDNSWARTVEDVLARRSRLLFLNIGEALRAAPAIAQTLKTHTGQDPQLEAFQLLANQWLKSFVDPKAG